MSEFKKKERALLMSICMAEKVPVALGEELLRTSETFAYETQSAASRVKQYDDLIDYHFAKKNG
ncbi:hypothetical protein HNQ44_001678 [Planomicrobium koreense]|uniref:Uncharacterized protein n=1 Tax=Planococcus koreensis TaxID=112331 RepID=A0A7W8FU59_9BACL|nr:hypothetical protein [Planococcus koreensis]MBB5180250.1 hypothetical protein [Planococcus koreensis]